jgi:hypothetical protein
MAKPDPIAAALDAAVGPRPGQKGRVQFLFGDRPEVLESIRRAEARGLSMNAIADKLSTKDASVSAGAVKKWLDDDKRATR